jgi:3-hydroxymyristoyl/3-hydroxydecanoyl-(acyl carrier protein) dehydratase
MLASEHYKLDNRADIFCVMHPARMSFVIDTDHPALAGHFPDHPVVPGVMIIDRVLDAVATSWPAVHVKGIRKMKFLRPLLPQQVCEVQLSEPKDNCLRFVCSCAGERIAEGSVWLEVLA